MGSVLDFDVNTKEDAVADTCDDFAASAFVIDYVTQQWSGDAKWTVAEMLCFENAAIVGSLLQKLAVRSIATAS